MKRDKQLQQELGRLLVKIYDGRIPIGEDLVVVLRVDADLIANPWKLALTVTPPELLEDFKDRYRSDD